MRKIVFIGLFIFFAVQAFGDIQELPDVEITGPSSLDTYTGKKGLISSELIIPDIVDSVKLILPAFPDESTTQHKQARNAFYVNVNQRLGFKSYLIYDSLFSKPYTFSCGTEYNVPKDDWKSFSGRIRLQYSMTAARLSIGAITINAFSPLTVSRQAANAININYLIDGVKVFNRSLYFNLKGELQQTYLDEREEHAEEVKMHVNNSLSIGYLRNHYQRYEIGGGLAYKTPFVSLKTVFTLKEEQSTFSFIRGISVHATDGRIMPGIHISRHFQIDSNNSFQLFQKSVVIIHDNISLLAEQPWQKIHSDVICEYLPINAHLIISNKSINLGNVPIAITADLGFKYYFDKPVFYASDYVSLFPVSTPREAISNELTVGALYAGKLLRLTQELKLVRARLVYGDKSYLPYQPELALCSRIEFRKKSFNAQAWLNQYYKTKDDLDSSLRESFDLGSRLEYVFSQRFAIHAIAENILNKGLYSYRTIPVVPPTYLMGFQFGF